MCVEEEGDGKAIRGGVTSITHQLIDHPPPPYLSHSAGRWERSSSLWLCFCLDAYISIFLPSIPLYSLFSGWMNASVQPGTRCIHHCCIGRADRWAVLWVMPLGGSTLDSSRRADPAVGCSPRKVFAYLYLKNKLWTWPLLIVLDQKLDKTWIFVAWVCFLFLKIQHNPGKSSSDAKIHSCSDFNY